MTRRPKPLELDFAELEAILGRCALESCDLDKLRAALETLAWITAELERKRASIARLRALLFGAKTEKTSNVLAASAAHDPAPAEPINDEAPAPKRRKGHGRNRASDYAGAHTVVVAHEALRPADPCPHCATGKLYPLAQPRRLVRVRGQPPLHATVYELERLRCHLCGELFHAKAPEGVGEHKYDESAASMVGLLKYGTGVPFNRLQRLHGQLAIPLPATTQWDIVHRAAQPLAPAYAELVRQAAQGELLHNDDTTMKVLSLMSARAEPAPERTGIFTSGIVATAEGRRIALFFTGRHHAGENLTALLAQRARELAPPIQMCDGLARNLPQALATVLANCLAHGRRYFVDVATSFPEQSRYVLETLREVYRNDALARKLNLSPHRRLELHQQRSAAPMAELHHWLIEQTEQRLVEPNCGLGQAIAYLLARWDALTLFLRHPGAPLDNNVCERALKKAILHRKNALFYKTENGARVGDLYMSLIYTAELAEASPFDYLTELQRHASEVQATPAAWMPWNYRDTLAAATPAAPARAPP
jgi:transposase